MIKEVENKKGYKKTSLGWIPKDWFLFKINQIGVVITGNTPPRSNKKYWNGDTFWATAQDFRSKYIVSTKEKITKEGETKSKILPVGSVLITCIASIGNNAISKVPLATNQQINSIIPYENFNNEYIYYIIQFLIKRLKNIAGKTAVPIVSKNEFEKFRIYAPLNVQEQKSIAEIISKWDNAIEIIHKIVVLKEKRKKALMQQLLTGKKRLKGFKVKWKEYKIYNIFDRVTRKNTEDNQNVVTISAQRGFVKQDTFFNKTVASENLLNYFLVERDEFCYNKSYSNGYPWGAVKVLKEFEKAVVTTLYICFKLKDKNENSVNFFEHFFEIGSLNKGLTKIAHEGGRAHGLLNVTPSDFMDLAFKIPNLKEQIAISEVIGSAIKEINLLKQKLELLKKQKQGLMQVLLTGKVRVAT